MAEVTLRDIEKTFHGKATVIPDLNLHIEDGSFTVLVGPSGCGKSTLLRMIAGLETVTQGTITIGGEDVTTAEPSDRDIAMVFQSYALYPHMTVARNIDFGMRLAKVPTEEREAKVAEAARLLNLEDLLERKPAELSGGQRQRVAIGRAIVRSPGVFLFDEPLSNLDASLRNRMRVELAELHQRLETTMVYVTHDQVEAMTLADCIVVMNAGQIEQMGKPMALYQRPETLFVAGFIGSPKMNLIEGELAAAYGATTLGIRPEHLEVSREKGEWKGRVRFIEKLGADSFAYIDSEQTGPLTVRLSGDVDLSHGDTLFITPQQAQLHAFDADGKRLPDGALQQPSTRHESSLYH
ncbi:MULTISPECIES: ABC transporter ATP-binding protein [Halomonadaceae]|uniref:Sn-glycerol-3-phosphate import ATP-binding protein UgpC n=1 Tax=Vreelandella titanicae TaxID=664683 RepID=A0AAP9NNB8_9GAMM|nr:MULTISPECIES: sn-glycerol-3-phosphate ABC transporter ATP-binding protein UgpC [Halomonas]QKS25307.1 sn-glycerol-3-phosphate import ATP-binding protein UgpC [Halomonas titanicae]CDG53542.1 putative sugar transporter subunit: ATP-binding component of ABC superfamily transporter [Halomonas sp. A3H3]SDJ39925.1 multiple sugar transport system ATP-binding protein [Halomonas titanicae]